MAHVRRFPFSGGLLSAVFVDQLVLVKYLRRASHVSRRPTTIARGNRLHAYARWQEPIHCAAGRVQLRVRASGLPSVRHVASAIIAGITLAHSHVRGAASTREAHVNISRKAVVAACGEQRHYSHIAHTAMVTRGAVARARET